MVSRALSSDSEIGEGFRYSVADGSVIVGTPGATRSASYQLQQYTNSPRRNDPYVPGQGGRADVAGRLADLDAVLSSLQKGGNPASL